MNTKPEISNVSKHTIKGHKYMESGEYDNAIISYNKGIEEYDKDAMYALGDIYYEGKHVKQDYTKARKLFEDAAYYFHDLAMAELSNIYMKGHRVPQDTKKGLEYIHEIKKISAAFGCLLLGKLYEEGKYVEKDTFIASEYYKECAGNGDSYGLVHLANMYMDNEKISDNHNKAFKLYKRAAAKNNGTALYMIGLMYWNGSGVEFDAANAIDYLQKALKQKVYIAYDILEEIRNEGFFCNDFSKEEKEMMRF